MFRFLLSFLFASVVSSLPFLDMSGFSWAENLLITHDGLNMFVSDNTRGELYRITLADGGESYSRTTHVSGSEISAFGGLAQSADGKTVYAGVTFTDKSTAIITSLANASDGSYSIFFRTTYQPNGLQIDLVNGVLYYTDTASGSLMAVHTSDSKAVDEVLVESLASANGCWLDSSSQLLYVGQLISKHVNVFDASTGKASLVRKYAGLSSLSMDHMLDDLTLDQRANASFSTTAGSTVLLGADYQGKAVQMFSLDGEDISEAAVSEEVLRGGELTQITSVRWGLGPNFDEDSVYVSEGGGMRAGDNTRRVFQIKMDE